jgi:hypothetical protein
MMVQLHAFLPWYQMEMRAQLHTLAALPQESGPQSRSEHGKEKMQRYCYLFGWLKQHFLKSSVVLNWRCTGQHRLRCTVEKFFHCWPHCICEPLKATN